MPQLPWEPPPVLDFILRFQFCEYENNSRHIHIPVVLILQSRALGSNRLWFACLLRPLRVIPALHILESEVRHCKCNFAYYSANQSNLEILCQRSASNVFSSGGGKQSRSELTPVYIYRLLIPPVLMNKTGFVFFFLFLSFCIIPYLFSVTSQPLRKSYCLPKLEIVPFISAVKLNIVHIHCGILKTRVHTQGDYVYRKGRTERPVLCYETL